MTAAETCEAACISDMGVRWDAVVVPRVAESAAAPPLVQPGLNRSDGLLAVHVRLFGALATLCVERSVRLELSAATTIADVLDRVEERLGAPFLIHVLDETGAKRRCCRLFVGGYAVEDVRTPLQATTNPTEIDIILLIAPEGG